MAERKYKSATAAGGLFKHDYLIDDLWLGNNPFYKAKKVRFHSIIIDFILLKSLRILAQVACPPEGRYVVLRFWDPYGLLKTLVY